MNNKEKRAVKHKIHAAKHKSPSTPKKAIIAVATAAAVIIVGAAAYFLAPKDYLQLEQESITVEYGDQIPTDASIYLASDTSADIIRDTVITNEEIIQDGKDYPAVGTYTLTLEYKGEEETVEVVVQDTTPPQTQTPDLIEILQGSDLSAFDFASLVEVSDLSNTNAAEFDSSNVDAGATGNYEVYMTVADEYENTTEKTLAIAIVDKAEIADGEVVVQEVVTNDDGTTTVKNVVKASSDVADGEKVVSTSENTVLKASSASSTAANASASESGSTGSGNVSASSGGESYVASYSIASQTSQIIDVQVSGSSGTLSLHTKINGKWTQVLSTSCRIGKNGATGNKSEGDGKTPTGTYSLGQAFGVASNPGCTRSYLQVNSNHYWVDDSTNQYYNKLVDASQTGVTWKSAEHLIDYPTAYKYAIAINYNTACTPYKGSAIFLHCSTGGATAGCVSVSQSSMVQILQNLTSDTLIYIH